MSGKLLEKYTARGQSVDDAGSTSEEFEDLGAFGCLRGLRERSLMIALHKKDGHILAMGYSFIDRMEYDPNDGIALYSGNRVITIKGRNLNSETRPRLFESICQHRVPWILESDRTALLQVESASPPTLTVIEQIDWQ